MKPQLQDYISLGTMSLFWGSAFVAIKAALVGYAPIELVTIRLILAMLFLLMLMYWRGHRLPRDARTWRILTLAGITGLSIPFALISWAMQKTDSGMAAIIIGTTPILTMAMSHWAFHDHKVTRRQAIGMGMGFFGVFLLMGGTSVFEGSTSDLSKLAILGAAFLYALSSVILKKAEGVSTLSATTGFTIAGCTVFFVVSLFVAPVWQAQWHLVPFLALTYLALFSTAIGTLIMTRLIKRVGPPFMSMNNYLTPVVAVLLGAYIYDEVLSEESLLSLALILTGIAIASYHRTGEKVPAEEADAGTPKVH